jgi:hypothetical protein
MTAASSKKNLFTRLCAAQAELAGTGIAKESHNKFDNYKYRGIDAVLNTIGPLLARHELLLVPSVKKVQVIPGMSSQGKPQNHATVWMNFTFYDVSGESITHPFVGEAIDRSDKAINKAETAAYKYFLFQTFSIPLHGEDGDADNDSPDVAQAQLNAPEPKLAEQIASNAVIPVPPAVVVPQMAAPAPQAPSTTIGPGGTVHTIPEPPDVAPVQYDPVPTAVPEQPSAAQIETPEAAAETTEVLIQLATKMHAGSSDELMDFWRKNKQTIDALDSGYPECYQKLKTTFTAIKQSIKAPQEATQ